MNEPRTDNLPSAWVQLTFVDVFGTSCSMLLPSSRLDDAIDRGVPFDGSALEGRARYVESDMRLVPQPETLITAGDGRSRVVCNVITPDGEPWRGDPRTTLEGVVEDLPDLGTELTTSAELEFYVLDEHGTPVDNGGYFDDVDGEGAALVRDAVDELASFGIDVAGCHHEAGPGQYEIDLDAVSPLRLADAIVVAKHTVRRLAADRGLCPTFMASPRRDAPGSGLHIHQRSPILLDETSGGLTKEGECFVAGQLDHAGALCALAAPNVNSYRRLHGGAEAPSAAVWGHRNRAALVRVSRRLGPESTIEFRGADPAANPYLLLAGMLVAGADGIHQATELPAPNDEGPGKFDPGGAIRFEPLPRNLDEALDALLGDDLLVDALDPVLVDILTSGRRAEIEDYRARVTSWELDRYLREA